VKSRQVHVAAVYTHLSQRLGNDFAAGDDAL
jgi:hypothetical protein